MSRDTIRAASRNITACSEPNCGNSAGCTGSRPPSAARRSQPMARSRHGPSRPRPSDWQTRTSYDFLRFEDLIQRDLAAPIWRTVLQAVWIYWRLVFGGTIAPVLAGRIGGSQPSSLTRISLLLLEALCARRIAFGFGKGLEALGIPDLFSIASGDRACSSPLLGTVLKYTENPTYLLYLLSDTIWTWEFSHRQRPEWDQRIDRFAAISRQCRALQRCRRNRHRRPQFGIVSGNRNAGARAQARSRARAGTARASSC